MTKEEKESIEYELRCQKLQWTTVFTKYAKKRKIMEVGVIKKAFVKLVAEEVEKQNTDCRSDSSCSKKSTMFDK